ncbi:MAG: A/G-specific adenine glycosylase [Paludibacteraceae bacterium]|nr:A/G-specific adenine glycosylase [Paludibacteraceae bacterium]
MAKSLIYSRLYEWYFVNRRDLPWRETDDPYAIWLSEIILQQTRVAQGLEYYRRFLQRWPTVRDLAAADEAEVLREWQGLGYYSRARNLHKAAQKIAGERLRVTGYGGRETEEGSVFPRTFEEIRALPGVGDYTAGAIASFAYNLPYPAMDGNVYRVVARLFDIDEPFDTTAGKKLFHKKIEELLDRDNPRLFNSAIMEFGALYCTPVLEAVSHQHSVVSRCESCPLADFCAAHAHGTAELLPVRKQRPKVRDRWFDYHIYLQQSAVSHQQSEVYTLIRRREDPKDIWYHLYEFPSEESESAERSVLCQPQAVCELSHVLSHQKIHARFIIHKVEELPQIEGTIAVRWEELDDYAFSRLTLRAIDTLRTSLPH